MNFKLKLAAVRRFERAIDTTVLRYYADDVGFVRHTPRTYYRVMKRNLREGKAKFKRRELYRFAKLAFLVANTPVMERRTAEVVFAQMTTYVFLCDLLLNGFTISTTAIKKAIAATLFAIRKPLPWLVALFSRLFDRHLYLTHLQLLF